MNATLTKTTASTTSSKYCVELRKRLERLEILRKLAALRSDMRSINIIDKQIKFTVNEWLNTFVFGYQNPAH